jgi:LysR family transcriptional activator of nhaA
MTLPFSYRHLYYFWVVAREGGMARAAARLGMATQTVSAQVGELERRLGHSLFKPAGRGLALTEAGQAALQQADAIFQLGQALPGLVADAAGHAGLRLQVGVGDGVPKLMVQRLLQPLLAAQPVQLRCSEGPFEQLLAELALHRLDLVLADHPAPSQPAARNKTRLHSQRLLTSPLAWYAAPALLAAAREGFPQSLGTVPVLLPLPPSATRERLEAWFQARGLRARVAGEFADSALLKTFGASGLGVFAAPALLHAELLARYQVQALGDCEGMEEPYWAITAERKLPHPLVQQLLQPA